MLIIGQPKARVVVLSIVAAIVAIAWTGCSSSSGNARKNPAVAIPAASPMAANPANYGHQDLGGEHVSFSTSDGVLLRGHLYGHGSVGVILAHMFPADQSDWTD